MTRLPCTGPNDPSNAIAQALGAAQQAQAAQEETMYRWAEPVLQQVMVALDKLCDMAENPRHPRQLPARMLLEGWVRVTRRAERATSPIVVPPAGAHVPNAQGDSV